MTTYGVVFNCSYETRPKLTIANVNHIIACMSNVNAEFGYLAESIIKRKGMAKKAVSEKSGIPYSTFNFMLRGQRAVTLDNILAIAEATESKPSAFIPKQFKSEALAEGGE